MEDIQVISIEPEPPPPSEYPTDDEILWLDDVLHTVNEHKIHSLQIQSFPEIETDSKHPLQDSDFCRLTKCLPTSKHHKHWSFLENKTNPMQQPPASEDILDVTQHNISKSLDISQDMENIIDIKECTYLVNQQMKEDRRTSEKHSHKLNVIICEQQTKEDLANVLHAACFSPVKSTCLQAIKNNHFTT